MNQSSTLSIELVLAVVALCAAPLGYFVRAWFDGRGRSETRILSDIEKIETENIKEHRDFDRRIYALEVRVSEALPALSRSIDDLKEMLAQHVRSEEAWQREIATFMGGMREHVSRMAEGR